jgi:hypothetical protein
MVYMGMMISHTDLKLLQILLSLPTGKLSNSERRAFHAMFDDLSNGKYIGLSKKQREWAEQVYLKNDLHKKVAWHTRKIVPKDKNSVVVDLGPMPLKPPGR